MNKEVMFSSKNNEWETPQWLFDKLDKEFRFDLDVCAEIHNTKCRDFYCKDYNALKQNWPNIPCWMNPPYGRNITNKWIKKAYEESLKGCIVVCLIPARTDTIYWHEYCKKAYEIRFLKGRLKFVGAKDSAPFPSALIIFNEQMKKLNNTLLIQTPFHNYVDYRS